ncbi:hypothetical protein [Paeniglutamicibacter sp. Y32M11]|uniref:hypothetical protein n=1 Tax=Paeniglutamicibacter sp. Y32M11 TaxID=2853258 RepID=UPI001C52A548|nr:hypothetical protein [Paeniglutamicibacter sp. Y32M11]QXQ10531.1 hypothetical protein KUF55_00800 [Paeniglutamicibacter sp. Y32M11]
MSSVVESQITERFKVARVIPLVFAALAFVGVLVIPLAESLYVFGHVTAIVSSLTATIYFFLKKDRKGRKSGFLFSVGLLGIASAIAASFLLSFGSKTGASGDIGGFALWLFSTMGLLVVLMISASEKSLELTKRRS